MFPFWLPRLTLLATAKPPAAPCALVMGKLQHQHHVMVSFATRGLDGRGLLVILRSIDDFCAIPFGKGRVEQERQGLGVSARGSQVD